jgi:hypothetical protein
MLTKAYIQEVISPHSIRVRIPLFNKIANVDGATPNDELSIGCVCTLPNFITDAHVGDIVIVGFEEDNISKPVVLGYLSTPNRMDTMVDVECNRLTVNGDTTLTEHTTIGDVKPESIKCLKDLKDNVNDTFKRTSLRLSGIDELIQQLTDDVISNAGNINIITTDISEIYSTIVSLANRVDSLNTNYNNLQKKFDDYLMKYPTILGAGTYGENLPTTGEPGQVYFAFKQED